MFDPGFPEITATLVIFLLFFIVGKRYGITYNNYEEVREQGPLSVSDNKIGKVGLKHINE